MHQRRRCLGSKIARYLRNSWRSERCKIVLGLLLPGLTAFAFLGSHSVAEGAALGLRAGAVAVDISPTKFPVVVNGGFIAARADHVNDPLFARALVLSDGFNRVAIVIVDSCMLPRDLIDDAKIQINRATGIPLASICIAATHTHSAPSAMGALGTPPDFDYVKSLAAKVAESALRASKQMVPARIGWATVDDFAHTHCRVWIRRPDKIDLDPFGEKTVRANMHPGYLNPDVLAPAGPVDPALTVISVQAKDGKTPIATLSNYSMHYYGASPVSADYYGRFSQKLTKLIGGGDEFVAMMSQGTSGDQMWMDYGKTKTDPGLDAYADSVADVAFEAYQSIGNYTTEPPIAVMESDILLKRRTSDATRLAWARLNAGNVGKEEAKNQKEVYAREAILFSEQDPVRSLKIQAIRIGELGLVAIPNEVYALTGLRIKAQSPLPTTCVIALANGSEGYIPPPEQHTLGGYTTWLARTAGLEVQAEPKIATAALRQLERAARRSSKTLTEHHGAYAESVLATQPLAYWRLGELSGQTASDSSPNKRSAFIQPGFALGLPGPDSAKFSGEGVINRCVHLAGGRIKADPIPIADSYTIEFWFWNALPAEVRTVVGDLFSLGRDADPKEELRLVPDDNSIRLEFLGGHVSRPTVRGRSDIPLKTWNHVALVRKEKSVLLYLNAKPEPEIEAPMPTLGREVQRDIFIGGTRQGLANFEGKIDEVAVYTRVLDANEISAHYTSGRK